MAYLVEKKHQAKSGKPFVGFLNFLVKCVTIMTFFNYIKQHKTLFK